jgi:hypothetical protein
MSDHSIFKRSLTGNSYVCHLKDKYGTSFIVLMKNGDEITAENGQKKAREEAG